MTASEIRALFAVASRPEVVSLAGGSPYTAALPLDAVGEMLRHLVLDRGAVALNYSSGQGDPKLREQICEVMRLVGINATADDVVVTVGSQQALDLVSRVLLDPGDVVLAESPSYVGALGSFTSAEANIRHVAMDENGLIPAALREEIVACQAAGLRIKFLYTIPNYQNPAGVSLSEERRVELLEIAEEYDLLIVEDDPYALLGFESEPATALRARDAQRVIYLGSFSKTFAPGMRVGWAVAPHGVREKLVLASEAQILCPPTFNQMAVSTYLSTQPWQEQIKVFRELYRERRDAMIAALTAQMPAGCSWTYPHGGFFVWVQLPDGIDAKAMQARAVSARVAYVPGIAFYANGSGGSHMRLSFCFPPPERIAEGVRRLAAVLEDEMDLRETFGKTYSEGPHPSDGSRSYAPAPDMT
ncbi:MAG TPA: PLP-dependent aminotransferase family protein [Frankiaceae bacterium]|nr:PLP-dependent aminotransferase family protein [Frankiaceae bacterium]